MLVAAEGRPRSICPQAGARRGGRQAPFPAAEPERHYSCGQQAPYHRQALGRSRPLSELSVAAGSLPVKFPNSHLRALAGAATRILTQAADQPIQL